MIAFRLNIVPPKATSQTKRLVMVGGKPRFFPKKEHSAAEQDLLNLCMPYRPESPMTGALVLTVHFVFPWRKSESKRNMALGRRPMDKRPDCDNLVKLVADVLTKLHFWGDDSQVSDLRVTKAWGDHPGIAIEIKGVEL